MDLSTNNAVGEYHSSLFIPFFADFVSHQSPSTSSHHTIPRSQDCYQLSNSTISEGESNDGAIKERWICLQTMWWGSIILPSSSHFLPILYLTNHLLHRRTTPYPDPKIAISCLTAQYLKVSQMLWWLQIAGSIYKNAAGGGYNLTLSTPIFVYFVSHLSWCISFSLFYSWI